MGEQTLIGGTETDEGDAHLSGGCTLRGGGGGVRTLASLYLLLSRSTFTASLYDLKHMR